VRPADTSPEAWKVFLDLQRRMPPGEKLQRAFEYSAAVAGLAEGVLRERYPQAGSREIFLRAARQRLGGELFRKAYGDELPDEPTCPGA
jgi:hypothetical protein